MVGCHEIGRPASPSQGGPIIRVDPRDFRDFGMPLGEWLLRICQISEDCDTRAGLKQAESALMERGGVFLDAHQSATDIFATAFNLTDRLAFKEFITPAAAYQTKSPAYRRIFRKLGAVPGVGVIEVYRREERGKTKRRLPDRSGLSKEEKKMANQAYKQCVKRALENPYRGVLLAPYGSRYTFGIEKEIRHGVIEMLMETEAPALATYSVFDLRRGGYVTFASGNLLKFSQGDTEEEVRGVVHNNMLDLVLRVDRDLSLYKSH